MAQRTDHEPQTTICADDAHTWANVDWKFLEHRPRCVANETWRLCERCPAKWHQIEVSHFDQPMADGSSRITVELGHGLVLPASLGATDGEAAT